MIASIILARSDLHTLRLHTIVFYRFYGVIRHLLIRRSPFQFREKDKPAF